MGRSDRGDLQEEEVIVLFDRVLSKLSSSQIHLLCTLAILGLGILDYQTGVEASFSVFYLLPISVMAWYVHSSACYIYSIVAAVVWDYSNVLAGEVLSHPVFYIWNGTVRLAFFLTVSSLLRQLREQLNREREFSRRDYRTGLWNARAFKEALAVEHVRALREKQPFSLAFLDLDHFKSVNDTRGHEEGDRVLAYVADTLTSSLRRSDVIARLGGDEFVVILPGVDGEAASQVGDKLVQSIRQMSKDNDWPVTASVGVLVHSSPRREDDLKALLRMSDDLMYRVKQQGRDSFVVAGSADLSNLSV